VLPAKDITPTSFTASWKKVAGAESYIVEFANDREFTMPYQSSATVDVGDLDTYILEELKPGKYYYRVRATSRHNRSEYSNVIGVEVK